MIVICKETRERVDLTCWDPELGVDVADSLMGGFADGAMMESVDIDWWRHYLQQVEDDMLVLYIWRKRFHADGLSTHIIDTIIMDAYAPNDVEEEHDNWCKVFGIIRERHRALVGDKYDD